MSPPSGMSKALALAFSLAAATALAQPATAAAPQRASTDARPTLDVHAVMGSLFKPAPDMGAELEKLRAARDAAKGKDRQILDRVVAIFEKLRQEPDNTPKHLQDVAQVLRDMSDLDPKDFETQMQIAWAFIVLPYLASSSAVDPAPLRAELLARAQKLVTDFPDQGRAYGTLAMALTETGADTPTIVKAYKQCVRLDPGADQCRRAHAEMIASLERPQCREAQVSKQFAIYGAIPVTAQSPGTGKRITAHGSTLDLEEHPSITSDDVALISLSQRAPHALHVQLSPAGSAKLKASTDRLSKTQGWMVFMFGDAPVFSARVLEPIPNGNLQISTGMEPAQPLMQRLCIRVETPAAPADLKL